MNAPVIGRGAVDDRQMAARVEALERQLKALGQIGTKHQSLRELALGGFSGGTASEGHRVLLSEGTYRFQTGEFVLNVPRVHLVGIGGPVVFRRDSNVVPTTRKAIVSITAARVRLSGIVFEETVSTDVAAVAVSAAEVVIEDCIFNDCWQAVEIATANDVTVRNCLVRASRDTGKAFDVTGVCAGIRFLGNHVLSAPTSAIYLGDSVTNSSAVSNIARSATYVVNYKTGGGVQTAGNCIALNAR